MTFFFSDHRFPKGVFFPRTNDNKNKKPRISTPKKSFGILIPNKHLRLQSIRAEKVAVLSLPPLGERDGRAAALLRLYNQWGRPRRNIGRVGFFS